MTSVRYLGAVTSIYGYSDAKENKNQSLLLHEFFRSYLSNRQGACQPWTFISNRLIILLLAPHDHSVRI